MKKLLLILIFMFISTGVSFAKSCIDFTFGPKPYQSLQKARFDKESTEHWQNIKRSADEYAENKYRNMDTSEIELMKPKPQINIDSNRTPQIIEENDTVKKD